MSTRWQVTDLSEDCDDTGSSEKISACSSSSDLNFNGSKKAKLQVWRPDRKPNHCPEGKDYLSRNTSDREIFDFYFELSSKNNTNYVGRCLCCGYKRTGSPALLIKHLHESSCSMEFVPDPERESVKAHTSMIAAKRQAVYNRDSSEVQRLRQPTEEQRDARPTISAWIQNAKTRKEVVRQQVSAMFVGCNLPASLAMNPVFRNFVCVISAGKITDDDVENSLHRNAVTQEMDRHAAEMSDKSLQSFTKTAEVYGGSLLVDGWSALRGIGTVGVTLCCLTIAHVLPLLICGTGRSRASDYVEKLEPVVPWPLVFFACTDGASNMILFGEQLQESRFILPNLCAAHGFSLMVHYIAKVFEARSHKV